MFATRCGLTFLAVNETSREHSSNSPSAMCIPIIFGCPTKVKQLESNTPGCMCPNCHNPSVVKASSRMWFELFWIPLIPLPKKEIWICGTCRWEMKVGDGPDPQPPQGGYSGHGGHHVQGGYSGHPPPPQGYNQPQGYQVQAPGQGNYAKH